MHGHRYTAEVVCQKHLGKTVQVKYDPANPAHNNDADNSTTGYVIGAIGVLGLALGVPSLVSFIRRERRESAPA